MNIAMIIDDDEYVRILKEILKRKDWNIRYFKDPLNSEIPG